jgi:hypothetical protein
MASEEHLRLEVEKCGFASSAGAGRNKCRRAKSRRAIAALALRGIAASGEEHVGHCDGDYLEASGWCARSTSLLAFDRGNIRGGAIRHDKFLSVWTPVVQAPLALTPAPPFSPK